MDWNPIETAPRDGQKVRLKGDDGKTFRGEFKAPHWWMIAPGARIADGHLFRDNGEIMRALEWQSFRRRKAMSYETNGPVQVFSLAEMLGEEMEARGWTTDDVAARMGPPDPHNYAIAALLLSVSSDTMKMTDDIFAGLSRAFDVSEELFRNMDATWRKWPDRRSDYDAPDKLYGPIAKRMFKLIDNDNSAIHPQSGFAK